MARGQLLPAVYRITGSNCVLLNDLAGVALVLGISLSQAPFPCIA